MLLFWTAEYNLIGMFTKPNPIEPFHIDLIVKYLLTNKRLNQIVLALLSVN
jgi:hypothetical protein